jgi:3-oxoacyl-[acyl-carrier protein] reductase
MRQNIKSLEGRIALVTAGTGLIGSEIVKLFASEGAKVIFTYHSNETHASSLTEYGTKYKIDLNNYDQIERMIYTLSEKYKRLDILVNNYGPILYKKFMNLNHEEFALQIQQNLYTTFFICQYAAEIMKKQKFGRIVNVAAAGAEQIKPKMLTLPYYIAKNGVVMLSKSFAREYAAYGLTVNTVSPGLLKNVEDAGKGSKTGTFKIPAGRKGDAAEVARVVLFLIQSEARYINGENINIDGGWSLT